jgi:peptide-methionine (R)-S-oxide reductase
MDENLKNKLKQELDATAYEVVVNKGTERPFTGQYNRHFEDGVYLCVACDEELFSSTSKFDAGCGWPSFDKEIVKDKITETKDLSHGMVRTEITCSHCGAHLGHVFNDGPTETGLRYCVNSVSLQFKGNDRE